MCLWLSLGFVVKSQLLIFGKLPAQLKGFPARNVAEARTWWVSLSFLQQMVVEPLTCARCSSRVENLAGTKETKTGPQFVF